MAAKKKSARNERKKKKFLAKHGGISRTEWARQKREARKNGTIRELLAAHHVIHL
jgi:hypothetical protein